MGGPAGAGGFVDITSRARKIVFSGYFNAGAKFSITDGRLSIDKEGKIAKIVEAVEHVSFSGRRGVAQGQDVTYVTERCVMKLSPEGLVVTEVAPGIDIRDDILARAEIPLTIASDVKPMAHTLFRPEKFGLNLEQA